MDFFQNVILKYLQSSKYTGDEPRYYSRDGFIYLTKTPTKNLKRIEITTLFMVMCFKKCL